jgi:hypothetical protein
MPGPLRNLTVAMVRSRIKQRLMRTHGWNAAKADKAVAKIGDGTILQWIKDHKGEIGAIIKIAISILLTFADEPPL